MQLPRVVIQLPWPPTKCQHVDHRGALEQSYCHVCAHLLPYPRLAAEAERVGFPLLVKAVSGGGGKGMKIAEAPNQLMDAIW